MKTLAGALASLARREPEPRDMPDPKRKAIIAAVAAQLHHEHRGDIDDEDTTMKAYGFLAEEPMTLFLDAVKVRLAPQYNFSVTADLAASSLKMTVGDFIGAIYDNTV
jgi:hypothetical protein